MRRSTPDLRPVLVPMVLLERFRRLTVVNYGWGTVPSVKLNARVNVADAPRSSNVIELGPLVGTAEADLTPAFREAGLDIAALRRYEAETPSDLAVARRALEPFGFNPERDVDVPVEGAISYRQGTERPGLVRFTARVPATRPTGLGEFQPPTARYSIVELATDDSLYERRVPLSQRLEPGSTDRFVIPVYAAQSSRHDLRVRLVYGTGETILTTPIALDLFVPRTP